MCPEFLFPIEWPYFFFSGGREGKCGMYKFFDEKPKEIVQIRWADCWIGDTSAEGSMTSHCTPSLSLFNPCLQGTLCNSRLPAEVSFAWF